MKRAALFAALLLVAVTGCTEKRTDPATLYNHQAQVPNNLPFDPLQWRVITSGANRADATMSTLYGNDLAVTHARTTAQHAYPTGAVLSLVTWAWQDDPHWFGAQIPAAIKSIEFVQVQVAPDGTTTTTTYESYEGSPLAKAPDKDAATQSARIGYIVNLRASAMP